MFALSFFPQRIRVGHLIFFTLSLKSMFFMVFPKAKVSFLSNAMVSKIDFGKNLKIIF